MQFSIILPAINDEANIRRCLEHISNLDWGCADYEVIVLDNGSSDRIPAIACQSGARLIVRSGLGISDLRNCGACIANGDVLVFMDADCNVMRACLSENYDSKQPLMM